MPSRRTPRRETPPTGGVISRRGFGAGVLSAAVLGALTACGANAPAAATSSSSASATDPANTTTVAASSASSSPPASSAPSSPAAGPTFPVRVEHKFGTTEITAPPTRVVSVGLTEQDFLLALGIVPVGVTDWYGDQPFAAWPWAQPLLGDAKPTVLSNADGIQFLDVAKLKPDLIVGVNAGMTAEDYAKLTRIAPTIGTPKAAKSEYFDSWPVYLRTIGEAVGKPQEAAALAAKVRAQFAGAAADHPEFAGKKAIFLQNAVYDGNLIAYQEGLGTEFLTDLGFEVPSELDQYVPAEGGQAMVPTERIEVLNTADYLIWGTEKDEDKAALEKVPGFAELSAVKNGHSVYTGGVLAGAIYFSTPLSLPYVVEKLVPLLSDQ